MAATEGYTSISVSHRVREEEIRPLLRGGETWSDLLEAMAEQYDPEA